ncbi:hypothetical protein EJ08DRAFT_650476 [Tothia fuscella]|uniref:Ribosome biogenesis protein SLX9 n=1 Tax=Tothia fuscella TaxID=1048955 RepID=A0A9P4NPV0_9PEZI|nr:hypothetical protein EJ08DRAFT_650476 [Tothia fuscella]
MAPIRPASKSARRNPIASSSSIRNPRSNYPSTPSDSSFSTTKKDKRTIKHSILLSKIQKSAPGGIKKRRRPSKKLLTTLESLADALPEDESLRRPKSTSALNDRGTAGSLKSKPGVRKRREKMEKAERERFGKNLAVLSQARPGETGDKVMEGETSGTSCGERWKALRAHIEASMAQGAG